MSKMSQECLEHFKAYAKDAGNWDGKPLVGANVKSGPIERGYLTKLKKAGFITTCKDEEGTWIFFTKAGVDLASELSIIICES